LGADLSNDHETAPNDSSEPSCVTRHLIATEREAVNRRATIYPGNGGTCDGCDAGGGRGTAEEEREGRVEQEGGKELENEGMKRQTATKTPVSGRTNSSESEQPQRGERMGTNTTCHGERIGERGKSFREQSLRLETDEKCEHKGERARKSSTSPAGSSDTRGGEGSRSNGELDDKGTKTET
jgi:hypothetical protein